MCIHIFPVFSSLRKLLGIGCPRTPRGSDA
jgi:hypothetical protein